MDSDKDKSLYETLTEPLLIKDFNELFEMFTDEHDSSVIPYKKVPHFISLLKKPLGIDLTNVESYEEELRYFVRDLRLRIHNQYVHKIDLYSSLIVKQARELKTTKEHITKSFEENIELQPINVNKRERFNSNNMLF